MKATRPRTTGRKATAALLGMLLAVSVVAACGSSKKGAAGTSGRTLKVPSDYKTITAAVQAAKPGDLVLVAPGVYHEAVDVTTNDIVIRGEDRNKVILDGDFTKANGIRVLNAKGVAVENMTARDYKSNGFFWTGSDGYRGSYLTAYRNGDYGVYAFKSTHGLFENSYASGSPDAGFYIGGCQPCDALIRNVVSEYNGLGYSGTNSGGNLVIMTSTFRHNRAGVVPNTGSYEPCYPERDNTIVGNLVYDNNYDQGPAIDSARLAQENGILIAGGWNNKVLRNLVYDHKLTGIALVPYPETNPSDVVPTNPPKTCAEQAQQPKPTNVPAAELWPSKGNTVEGNVVRDSGLADLATADSDASAKNCFADNTSKVTAPLDLETLLPCSGTGSGDFTKGPLDLAKLVARETAPSGDYKTQPVPAPQPNMPDAKSAKAVPATNVPPTVDIDAVKVPKAPS
ncbi:MAG TPA: right-handed parallel beta-helix repeat-containing protein [Acidimicrobiales bacterium]|jgi:hypothetical protein|nr:right-handed parallel beta-helix repeat-containing protein [Acidimicrobiales bacterium]